MLKLWEDQANLQRWHEHMERILEQQQQRRRIFERGEISFELAYVNINHGSCETAVDGCSKKSWTQKRTRKRRKHFFSGRRATLRKPSRLSKTSHVATAFALLWPLEPILCDPTGSPSLCLSYHATAPAPKRQIKKNMRKL